MYRFSMVNLRKKHTLLSSLVAFLAVAVGSLSGCGNTGTNAANQKSADLQRKLEACEQSSKQKDGYARSLKERIEELENKDAGISETGGEVVVTISGDGLQIVAATGRGPNETAKPNKPGTKPGNADDQALYKSFLKAVNRSRGGIKKCYQRALKADSSLQARTISMKIKVKYNVAGQVTGTGFSPRISSKFDSCMSSITKRWKLPAPPRPVSFRAPVTLTPQ